MIDTDVRVRAQEGSLRRVEQLLARARSLKDIVWIESQLTQRQAELDSLKSQQAWLSDQTSDSTITIDIERKHAPKVEEEEKDEPAGFLVGLKGGMKALGAFASAHGHHRRRPAPVRDRAGRPRGPDVAARAPYRPASTARQPATCLTSRRSTTRVGGCSTDSPSATRIAVLIDADNTSPKYAEALLSEVARDGNPTIRRVYGDWSSTRGSAAGPASSTRSGSRPCTSTRSPPARTRPTRR